MQAGNLYVFGGMNNDFDGLNSIEKLQVKSSAKDQNKQVWKLIDISRVSAGLTPRHSSVVCSVSKN